MKDDRADTDALRQVLSPLNRLSDEAIPLLRERLIQGGSESFEDKKRRGNALAWVEALRKGKIAKLTWAQRPQEICEDHWHDLQAGAVFFEARAAAIAVLDAVEISMGPLPAKPCSLRVLLPEDLKTKVELLKSVAKRYLELEHADEEANKFCRECVNDDSSSILQNLVKRDGHVLRLVGDEIKPGQAFRGSATQVSVDDDNQETPQAGDIPLPEGISYRVRNLYLLNLDMHGELDGWLTSDAGRGEA
jgi:hypothetical protein